MSTSMKMTDIHRLPCLVFCFLYVSFVYYVTVLWGLWNPGVNGALACVIVLNKILQSGNIHIYSAYNISPLFSMIPTHLSLFKFTINLLISRVLPSVSPDNYIYGYSVLDHFV
jgi:hypothetical protein